MCKSPVAPVRALRMFLAPRFGPSYRACFRITIIQQDNRSMVDGRWSVEGRESDGFCVRRSNLNELPLFA